mmetsp:Transcript_44983/g.72237  ORF Transcript_44983/g.72237 Transcript_44983/m.72237 type:complete len:241 (+) Transcript_44983:174-896(+)
MKLAARAARNWCSVHCKKGVTKPTTCQSPNPRSTRGVNRFQTVAQDAMRWSAPRQRSAVHAWHEWSPTWKDTRSHPWCGSLKRTAATVSSAWRDAMHSLTPLDTLRTSPQPHSTVHMWWRLPRKRHIVTTKTVHPLRYSIMKHLMVRLRVQVWCGIQVHTTEETMMFVWTLWQDLILMSSMSNTSHCLELKNVAGPMGGPSSGGTTTRRRPPSFIPLRPSSNPGIIPLIPRRVDAGTFLR